MFQNIGTTELIIIGLVFVLLFGGKKLPELTRSLIHSLREFRNAYREGSEDDEDVKELDKLKKK